MTPLRKRLKQADPQPVATHPSRFGAHGKEGVDGSSPSEGFASSLLVSADAAVLLGAQLDVDADAADDERHGREAERTQPLTATATRQT